MCSCAIFDLDGTLLNTLEDIAGAVNYALDKHNFPIHPVDSYKYFVGNGVLNLICAALPTGFRDDVVVSAVKKDYTQYYAAHSTDKTKPYSGILEMLDSLKAANTKLATLSNKPHEATCSLVHNFFPGLFDMVLGQRDGIPHKPDPTAVFEIVNFFASDDSNGFYIGDSATDMLTGKNAGLYTIGVSWGFRTKSELVNNGADVIVDKPCDLLKIIVDK